MDPSPRPAQDTKHLAVLSYPFLDARFSLRQLDDGQANGTALWLGAQCLSLYLPSLLSSPRTHHTNPRPAALDLGSGIGLTALALRSLGCDVLATDTEQVISSVLRTNILNNPPPPPLPPEPSKSVSSTGLYLHATGTGHIHLPSRPGHRVRTPRPPIHMLSVPPQTPRSGLPSTLSSLPTPSTPPHSSPRCFAHFTPSALSLSPQARRALRPCTCASNAGTPPSSIAP